MHLSALHHTFNSQLCNLRNTQRRITKIKVKRFLSENRKIQLVVLKEKSPTKQNKEAQASADHFALIN